MSRIFNFNAGPAALPLEVLEEVQAELLDFNNTGMSILEISHRSPAFEKVLEETKQDIKDLSSLWAAAAACSSAACPATF